MLLRALGPKQTLELGHPMLLLVSYSCLAVRLRSPVVSVPNGLHQGLATLLLSLLPLFLMTVVLQLVHQGNSYQREPDSVRQVSNILSPRLPGTTLDGTLSDSSRMNGSQEGWRPRDSSPHSRTFGESAIPGSRCCYNGGTCVLGSFCVCPAHFTGRYCEHDQRRRDCGALGHGAWTLHSCRLCRCIFSALYCLPRQTFGHCDLKGFLSSGSSGTRGSSASGALSLLMLGLLLQGVAGDG